MAFPPQCQGWGHEGVQVEAPSPEFCPSCFWSLETGEEEILPLGNETQEETDSCFERSCEWWYVHTHFIWIYVFVYILFISVFVPLGCSNKCISHCFASPRSTRQHVAFWWGPLSWFIAGAFFLHPHKVEGAGGLSGVSFKRTLIPLMRAPPSVTWALPRGPTSKYHHLWWLGIQHEFGKGRRHKHWDHSNSKYNLRLSC